MNLTELIPAPYLHPLAEQTTHPEAGECMNAWGAASMAAHALSIDGRYGPAAQFIRRLLGDNDQTTELINNCLEEGERQEAHIRLLQSHFAFELDGKARDALCLD